ncbi:GtrA family protein [Cellulomonas fimi]|uniref:GtrA family protein n=1 Tax=Cellulomonas fimi (strain ATCC 484 / DSM 20113 / JCM 1341 / CCUG 24087 / LMG 16345 / NBRC 15513 / NCIMB 8980 / NCTC 7547 / NRS-133) TaxID=590998 RepID=F4H4E5_CELFA|nr:GtrA family protein [Cellulomonas fimi]AEE46621.1 GtrA family protein [Cellulomonas fimi ATCC 484]NNH08348.1 GtrA family protein [Cellulomonas fimi]VEH33687.1 GtrA-like protein [Cellulomonas fimi]
MTSPTSRHVDRVRTFVQGSVLARFASVGVINTLVDFGVYVLLFALGTAPVLANLISTTAGLIVSFLGNSRFVFRSTGGRRGQVARFVLVAGIGIWVIQPAVILGVTAALDGLGVAHVGVVGAVAKTLAIGVAAVWNYLLYSRFVFRSRHAHRAEETPA